MLDRERIENLEVSEEFTERNFALSNYKDKCHLKWYNKCNEGLPKIGQSKKEETSMKKKYFAVPNSGIFVGMDKIARIDSRTVAEAFGESHDSVMKAIENLEVSDIFNRLNFKVVKYKAKNGEFRKCYEMTREGFTYLVSGYTKEKHVQIRKEFFKRFNEIEASINDKLAEKYA